MADAPVDSIDQALVLARDAIRELRRPRPGETTAEARLRSSETIKAQRRLIEASRKTVTDTVAAARKVGLKANGSGSPAPEFSPQQLARPVRWKSLLHVLDTLLDIVDKPLRAMHDRIAGVEAVPCRTPAPGTPRRFSSPAMW